jgi:hypothetical protein
MTVKLTEIQCTHLLTRHAAPTSLLALPTFFYEQVKSLIAAPSFNTEFTLKGFTEFGIVTPLLPVVITGHGLWMRRLPASELNRQSRVADKM